MKKFLIALTIASSFIACKKNSDDNNAVASNGKLEYKVNGQLYTYENINETTQYVLVAKQINPLGPNSTRYMLNAVNGPNSLFAFALETDSLTTGPITIDSTAGMPSVNLVKYTTNQAGVIYSGDNLTFNITSYTNGRISGTFTGAFTPLPFDYSTKNTIVVTEGKLDNVQVQY